MYDMHICVERYVSKCIHILCNGDVEGNTNPSYFVCSSSLAHSFEVFRVFLVRRGWSFDEGLVKWHLWNSRVFMFIKKYICFNSAFVLYTRHTKSALLVQGCFNLAECPTCVLR